MLGIDMKSTQKAFSYALVAVLLWSLFTIRATILLFALALMFAYLFYPAVEFVQERFKPKKPWVAVTLPFVSIMLIGVAGFFLMRAPVLRESHTFRQQIASPEFRQRLVNWQPLGFPLGVKIVDGHNLNQLENEIVRFMPQLGHGVSRAWRDIANIFIIPILAFLMLKDGRQICDCFINLCFRPSGDLVPRAMRRLVVSILYDAHSLIREYMRSLVLLCFVVLVAFGTALKLMGVQYALLLSLLAFALEFIPLIGPLVAGSVILLMSQLNQYPHLGWVFIFLVLFRVVQDYVLSPHLMERTTKLHPLLAIFGVFAGGEIGGICGIFLSVPLLALGRLAFYECLKYREADCAADRAYEGAIVALQI